ncbi:MAG: EAL domain-containing protein, partial [Magnetospiraceae bacterium]
ATERIKLRGTAEFLGNELESLNQIYDEMLAALSYQMRTPLNNVLGFTELIESELFGPLPNEQYRGYVRDISKSGRLMLNTLDGLLDRGRFNVLKRQEAGYRHIIELAPDMMLICRENHIVFINPAGISLLGIESADEVVGKSFETFVHPDFKDVVAAGLTPLTRRHGRVPLMLKKADGRDIEIEVSALDYQEPNEAPGIMLVARDLTEINRAARIANDREERLQRVVDTVADGIITLDENGIVQTVNRAACRILRDQANDIIGQSFAPFLDTDVGSLIRLLDARLSEGNVHSTGTERRFKRGDGEAGYIDLAVSKLVLEDGKNLYIAVIRDVTERKQSEEKLRYLATRDHLTGLPNYALFLERLEVAISISAETESIIGILFVDLDHFKNINDTLGHTAGDQVLRMAGDRLLACVDESDTVSRLGADEYMILLETIDSTDEAARIAQKVCSSLSTPFEVNGRQVYTSASIGVALYPTHAESTSELVKHVDTATHHAKHLGRNNIQFYTEELSRKMLRHLELESGLREALNRNEFTVYYQPQVSLVSRQVVGAEALIRWHSAELGQVSPAEFIPVAEATGLIAAIGEWVLREACMQLAAWRRAGWDDMTISVNISARQFHQSDLAERIAQILEETGAPAEYLDLELTEGVLIEDAEETLHILAPLKEMGISVSVDDFGTGYSSLNYLKRFPIDTLKIDRSFIKDIPTDADDMAITRAIVTLANTLDLKTVAEGVESEDQLVFLSALGCTLSQGYLTGKPVPAAAFTRRLVDQKNPVAKRG